jgi:AmiR/NasT family two-component response regulator
MRDFGLKCLGRPLAALRLVSMSGRPRIAVACHSPAERTTVIDWLKTGGFEPVMIGSLDAAVREIDSLRIELVIADAQFRSFAALGQIMRGGGSRRPTIMLGDADRQAQAEAERRGATYVARPLERASLLFTVTLALAEGRPARRSPRKLVPRLQSMVDGVASHLIDVSHEGVRLEVPERHRAKLPPYFTVRVPMFNVGVTVKRVWVSTPVGVARAGMLWCGGMLEKNPPRSADAWRRMVDTTPALYQS